MLYKYFSLCVINVSISSSDVGVYLHREWRDEIISQLVARCMLRHIKVRCEFTGLKQSTFDRITQDGKTKHEQSLSQKTPVWLLACSSMFALNIS